MRKVERRKRKSGKESNKQTNKERKKEVHMPSEDYHCIQNNAKVAVPPLLRKDVERSAGAS